MAISRTFQPSSRNRSAVERFAVLAAAILQIVATTLPALGLGETIGERSDEAQTLITPVGWAFSIWGPLFAGSLAFGVYQLLPVQVNNPLLARIAWASAGAFAGNALWALYAQFLGLGFPSALIIIFTLGCLLFVYRTFALVPTRFSRSEQFLVVLPLSALAAWLTAATIVNIAAVLEYHGVNVGDAAPAVAAAVVLVGGGIASAALWSGRGNPWFAAVFLWALTGIFYANSGTQNGIVAAVVAAGIAVAATTAARLARKDDRRHWFAAAKR
jgi:hypothetical protein